MPALLGCMSVEQAFPRLGVPQFPAQVRRDGCGECSGRNTCFVILNFSGKKNWIVLYHTQIFTFVPRQFELIKTMQCTLTAVYNAVEVLYLGASTATASGKRTCVPLATPISLMPQYSVRGGHHQVIIHFSPSARKW